MAYVQTGSQSQEQRDEYDRQQEAAEWLKDLENSQALIRIKLSIALRGGMTRDLRDQITEAAADYGKAFERLLAACPVQQKMVTRR
jgi:hypothetical protein